MDRPSVALIKRYEGLERRLPGGMVGSYLCPERIWSIGFGSTRLKGVQVTEATVCTIAEAEHQFALDVADAEATIKRIVRAKLTQSQIEGLISFIYNIGATEFAQSTFLKRVNAGEDVMTVARQELPRWTNDGLPGLVERRHNEVQLMADSSDNFESMKEIISPIVRFSEAAEYDRGLLHQTDAWAYLQANTTPEVQLEFSKRFRSGPARATGDAQQPGSRRLVVAHESQHDNRSGQGFRECFSSSCGAIARFHGVVGGDDQYNAIRARYGDTTDAQAQIKALQSLGLKARLRTDGTPELLKAEILAGRPVAVGWIHKGPLARPTGDGHWSVVTGFTPMSSIHADPNGEADILNGGYVNKSGGDGVTYSWANWRRRWEVAGGPGGWSFAPGNGWMLLVSK